MHIWHQVRLRGVRACQVVTLERSAQALSTLCRTEGVGVSLSSLGREQAHHTVVHGVGQSSHCVSRYGVIYEAGLKWQGTRSFSYDQAGLQHTMRALTAAPGHSAMVSAQPVRSAETGGTRASGHQLRYKGSQHLDAAAGEAAKATGKLAVLLGSICCVP